MNSDFRNEGVGGAFIDILGQFRVCVCVCVCVCGAAFETRNWFSVNDQPDAQFLSMYLFLFLTLYMFRAHRAHHQERQIVSVQPDDEHDVLETCRELKIK